MTGNLFMKKKLILTIALLFVGVFSFSVNAASSRFSSAGDNYSVIVDVDYIETVSNGVVYDVCVSVQNLQPLKWVISSQFPSLTFNFSGNNYQVFDTFDCSPYISSYGVVSLYPENNIVLAPGEMKQFHFKMLSSGATTVGGSVSFGNFPSSSAYSFEDLIVLPADELAYLQQLDTRLSEIIRLLTYVGTTPSYSVSGKNSLNVEASNFNNLPSGFSLTFNIARLSSFILTQDFEALYPNVSFVSGSYATVFEVRLLSRNNNSTAVSGPVQITINDVLPRQNVSYFVLNSDSDLFSEPYFTAVTSGDYVTLNYRNLQTPNVNTGYFPSGYHYSVAYIIAVTSTPVVVDRGTSISFSEGTYSLSGKYVPSSILIGLSDFWHAIVDPDRSQQDQLSSDITSTSNSIHTQEEQYFSSNAQAIQATGLSNYRFDQNQTGGISAVSNDFTAVFNALGGFNSVFIFSLTLSLALQIFRHHPIVFRAKQVNAAPDIGKGDS